MMAPTRMRGLSEAKGPGTPPAPTSGSAAALARPAPEDPCPRSGCSRRWAPPAPAPAWRWWSCRSPIPPPAPGSVPGSMVKETSSTARTTPALRPRKPPFTGKSLLSRRASTTGVVTRGPGSVAHRVDAGLGHHAVLLRGTSPRGLGVHGEPAAAEMGGGDRDVGRRLLATAVHRLGAARMEGAAGGERREVGGLALDGGEPPARSLMRGIDSRSARV